MNLHCKQLKLQSQSGNVRHDFRLENKEEAGERKVTKMMFRGMSHADRCSMRKALRCSPNEQFL